MDYQSEMLGADGVGVGVLRRAPYPVGGQQNSAFEDEVAGMGGAVSRSRNDSRMCRIRYSCVGAPVPLFAAAERATDWIRRNTVSPKLTPASPMPAYRGLRPR
jgi:hypothetical protein